MENQQKQLKKVNTNFDPSHLSSSAPQDKVEKSIERLNQEWAIREAEFVEKLNWFYESNFEIQGWTAFLIRYPICPYYTPDKWFAVSFNPVAKQLKTIGHELFHQPFHLFWQRKCEKIFRDVYNPEGVEDILVVRDLKEALPELLNTPEFKLSDVIDKGHPEPGEQLFRHLIRKYYQDHGPFTFKEFLKNF